MDMAKGLCPGVPLPHSTVVSERVGNHNPGLAVVSAGDSAGNLGHCSWGPQQQAAFEMPKKVIAQEVMLACPDLSEPFC